MKEKAASSQILERITKNILFLAAQKSIKKSDLETKAGVTPGYLSRFKPDSSSLPSSAFLIEAAKVLEVTLDDLIYQDYPQEAPDLIQPVKVVTKLLNETSQGKLKWTSILEIEIKEAIYNRDEVYCDDFKLNFDPADSIEIDADTFFKTKLLLCSNNLGSTSLKDYSCWLNGTIYAANLGSRITFMLIPMERVHRDSKYIDKAIGFFISRYDFIQEQFTVSQKSEGLLKERLFKLYRVIEQTKNNLSRSKDYDRVFELYLEGKSLDSENPVEEGEDERHHFTIRK